MTINVVAFIVFGYLTRKYQRIIETLSDTPKIVVYLRRDDLNSSCLILCIENVGKGWAKSVRFQTDFQLKIFSDASLGDLKILKEGIDYFGIEQKYEYLINSLGGTWDKLIESPVKFTITYLDSKEESYKEEIFLDFSVFHKVRLPHSPIGKIAKNIEKIAKTNEKMTRVTEIIGQRFNRYQDFRVGDKVEAKRDIPGIINGNLSHCYNSIREGEICTVIEVTDEQIVIELDNAFDSQKRVTAHLHRSTCSYDFELYIRKLPPKSSVRCKILS